MMKRPVVAFSFSSIIGVLGADVFSKADWFVACLAAACFFVCVAAAAFLLWRQKREDLYFFTAVLLCFLLLFGLRTAQLKLPDDHICRLIGVGRASVEGRLAGMPRNTSWRTSYDLIADRCLVAGGWRDCCGVIKLHLYGQRELLAPGERVRVSGKLKLPDRALNPGQFDYRHYLANQDIHRELQAQAVSCLRLDGGRWAVPGRWLLRLRLAAESALVGSLGEETARPMKAFLFGKKDELAPNERDDFNRTGIAHVLAVSGLHVGLVFGFFYLLLRVLRCPLRWAMLAALGGAALYTMLTGAEIPALRATLMAAVVVLSFSFGREVDLFSVVLLVGIFFLLFNPGALHHPGFQLSFLVTLGIIALAPRLEAVFAFLPGRYLRSLVVVAIAAQLAVFPLTACHFHLVAPVGLLLNLLVVPLLSIALALGFIAMLFYYPLPFLAQVFGASGGVAAGLLMKVSSFFAALPGGYFHLPSPLLLTIAGYYFLLFSFSGYFLCSRRQRLALTVLFLLCLNAEMIRAWCRAPQGELEISFLSVGQGDAALLRCRNGGTVLIDCGAGPPAAAAARVVAPFLWELGVRRLDAVVLSHRDYDHAGGLAYLLRNFEVGAVIESVAAGGQLLNKELPEELIQRRAAQKLLVAKGQEIEGLPGIRLKVVHPPSDYRGNDNDGSLTLLVETSRFLAFFGGDIGVGIEKSLVSCLAGRRLDVLKVGHHGSAGSTSREFLSRTQPRLAVISCAGREEHGLPSTEVIKSLLFSGASVLRTDKRGMVRVSVSKSGEVEVETFIE